MQVIATHIPDVKIIKPKVFGDQRGFFLETWNARDFCEKVSNAEFVQDNHSRSKRNTLRGLHYQINQPQGKLVRCTLGKVFDVAVDLRKSSNTFGHWVGELLTEENKRHLWIPPGFAHGILVLSDMADFQYKCTDYYAPHHERTIAWNDEDLNIKWPLQDATSPLLSKKDESADPFRRSMYYE